MAEPASYEPVPSADHEDCTLKLKDLSNDLEPVADWHTLGVKLGVEDYKLREIEEQYHDPQRRKHEMLAKWYRKGQNCTWRRVVEVLMLMGEMVVADTIRLKYLTVTTGPQTSRTTSVLANPVVDAVARRNLIVIRGKWGELIAHADKVLQNKLDNKEITSNEFRHILSNLYSCEGKMNGNEFLKKLLKPSANISEMFEMLTVEGAWDFLNYYPLECIIEKFGNDSTRNMMEQYKQDLNGYTLVTAIKDHLDAVDLERPTHRILPMPQEKLFVKLSCKVKVKITDHSLTYVRDVWRSLAGRFSLPMPALLLNKIAKGCLEVMWHIPSELAANVIEKAKQSDEYFKEQHFVRVSVDGKNVYTESEVGDEVKGKPLPVAHVEPAHTEGNVEMKELLPKSFMVSAERSVKIVEIEGTASTRKYPQVMWQTLGTAPEEMERVATAVDGRTVYVSPGYSHRLWAYDLTENKWTGLPDCPQQGAGLAVVSGLLTAVGGETNDGLATNTLVSLTESRSEWTERFSPMPMKAYEPAVICTDNHLVVVANMETSVHVMDATSLMWFSASSLPWLLVNPSLVVCGTELFVLSYGFVFSCSLPALLQSSSAVQPDTTDVWQSVADVPVDNSTPTTLCGQLVAMGGHNVELEPVDTIHLYNPSLDSWHIIGYMPTARYDCIIAALPGDTLVVIGGVIREGNTGRLCDLVEVAYPV